MYIFICHLVFFFVFFLFTDGKKLKKKFRFYIYCLSAVTLCPTQLILCRPQKPAAASIG